MMLRTWVDKNPSERKQFEKDWKEARKEDIAAGDKPRPRFFHANWDKEFRRWKDFVSYRDTGKRL